VSNVPIAADSADTGSSGTKSSGRLWRRFARDKFAVLGLLLLLTLVVLAVFAPFVAQFDPEELFVGDDFEGPSGEHWLGTDHIGRDNASRIIFGSRIAIRVCLQVIAIALAFAVPIGLVAGYVGKWVDNILMRLMDAILSVPALVLALSFAAASGLSFNWALTGISIAFVPTLARLVRAETLGVRQETFIEASRAAGTPTWRILMSRVLPNVASPIIVQGSLYMGAALLVEAALSILGVGVPPGKAAWGSMLSESFDHIFSSFWNMFYPGAAIAITVLAFNLVGDGLRDSIGLDPGQRYGATGRMGLTLVERRIAAAEARQDRQAGEPDEPLLSIEGLRVEVDTESGPLTVVEDITFSVGRGEIVGLVGESGSGKSITSLATMRLIPSPPGRVTAGQVIFEGRDLTELSFNEMRRIRGRDIAMIFQDPMAGLNPAFTVGRQIAESVMLHERTSRRVAQRRAIEMLDRVGIQDPQRRVKEYPHEFSGGMRQRAMIAIALASAPKLLIADEPTTALDVTIQAQILTLLKELQQEFGLSVIFVTHDLGVVADLCDRVVVLYSGQVVEQADVVDLFARPTHPYTEGLLAAMPRVASPSAELYAIPGQVPALDEMPDGCRFHPRCAHAQDRCTQQPVSLVDHQGRSLSRCIRHDELDLRGSHG
jgi:oligopeptide/dipeptide ABC transporter ATP-binding protein